VITSKAVLFDLDPKLKVSEAKPRDGSRSNKISYLVSTRLNWNKQVCIITFPTQKINEILFLKNGFVVGGVESKDVVKSVQNKSICKL
jgi:hypothetical protein